MLLHLDIRNLAVIDHVDLDFTAGLNVITGETGAGKSILLDALQLLLGGRADRQLIRRDAKQAEIQALFRVDATSEVAARLVERDLVDHAPSSEVDVVVRRIVTRSGRGRATVNGALVTIRELQSLTRGLVEITGQHDQGELLRPERHLELLDTFAGHEPRLEAMGDSFRELERVEKARRTLEAQRADQAAREDYLRFQLQSFRDLAMEAGEDERLEAEERRLSHAAALVGGSRQVESSLSMGPENVLSLLGAAIRTLEGLAEHDPDLGEAARRLEATRIELDDVSQDMRRYAERVDQDPNRLRHVSERLSAIRQLARRHGLASAELPAHRLELEAELGTFEDLEDRLEDIAKSCGAAQRAASALATELTDARREACAPFAQAIERELQGLGMDEARVDVRLVDRDQLVATGAEGAELYVETNQGEGSHALRHVASGGELSRLMLAIDSALRGAVRPHTAIYDEVDAGVSGAIADAIGRKLRSASEGGQAIVITHMPQIAAQGDHHLTVTKRRSDDRTETGVRPLNGRERAREIARMLGGDRPTKRVRDHAMELLERGRRAA